MREFEVLPEHIKLLKRAHIHWENCEFGAPAIDCKRPYGNSSVIQDIAEILEWPLFKDHEGDEHLTPIQHENAYDLHKGTFEALQIFLCTGRMKPGVYVADDYENNWRLK